MTTNANAAQPNAQAPAAPVPGTPEYDEAMLKAGDRTRVVVRDATGNIVSDTGAPADNPQGDPSAAVTPPPGSKPERPAHIPEKFWNAEKGEVNVEALARSYTELERARANPQAQPNANAQQPNAQPQVNPQGEPNAAMQSLLTKAASEYEANKTFTPETFTALEAAGIPRSMAEGYVQGLAAQAELATTKVYAETGGAEQFKTMQAWATNNLSDEQIDAFNKAIHSRDLTAVIGAVRNLKGLYEAANGSDPNTRILPDSGSNGSGPADMYHSRLEVQKDMSDPRYKSGDKAFHAQVDRKLANAMRAGIDLGF